MLQTTVISKHAMRAPSLGTYAPERPASCAQGCRFFEHETGGTRGPAKTGPLVKFARRATIYSSGDRAQYCYKVVEGAVRLSKILMDGHRQILDIFLPNDTFGLDTSETYSATAEAVGDVALLRCSRACIERLSEQPDMRYEMITMLSRGLSSAQDHIAMLGHQGAKERVASYLLKLASRSSDDHLIDLPMSRQDIADYLGLTIETTCRVLTGLKSARVIATPNRHQVAIRNLTKLEETAGGDA